MNERSDTMPAMARKMGSHADITGPKVEAAAIRLFARHGYAAVSMRQIAAEVGVQAGALYLYTKDKQTLLFDLMRKHMEELLAASDEAVGGATPLDRLDAFVAFHIRYHMDRADEVFISYMELRNLEPDNFVLIEELRGQYENRLAAILKAGQKAEVLRVPDVKITTMAIIAMLTGVNTWYREGGRLSRDRIERIYTSMVRRLVKA